MNLLIDAQLPPALCGWLRERGHQAVHVFEIGMVAASDAEIAALPDGLRRGGSRQGVAGGGRAGCGSTV